MSWCPWGAQSQLPPGQLIRTPLAWANQAMRPRRPLLLTSGARRPPRYTMPCRRLTRIGGSPIRPRPGAAGNQRGASRSGSVFTRLSPVPRPCSPWPWSQSPSASRSRRAPEALARNRHRRKDPIASRCSPGLSRVPRPTSPRFGKSHCTAGHRDRTGWRERLRRVLAVWRHRKLIVRTRRRVPRLSHRHQRRRRRRTRQVPPRHRRRVTPRQPTPQLLPSQSQLQPLPPQAPVPCHRLEHPAPAAPVPPPRNRRLVPKALLAREARQMDNPTAKYVKDPKTPRASRGSVRPIRKPR